MNLLDKLEDTLATRIKHGDTITLTLTEARHLIAVAREYEKIQQAHKKFNGNKHQHKELGEYVGYLVEVGKAFALPTATNKQQVSKIAELIDVPTSTQEQAQGFTAPTENDLVEGLTSTNNKKGIADFVGKMPDRDNINEEEEREALKEHQGRKKQCEPKKKSNINTKNSRTKRPIIKQ